MFLDESITVVPPIFKETKSAFRLESITLIASMNNPKPVSRYRPLEETAARTAPFVQKSTHWPTAFKTKFPDEVVIVLVVKELKLALRSEAITAVPPIFKETK